MHCLAGDPQRRLAGRQDPHFGGSLKQRDGELCASVYNVLAVVQVQKGRFVPQVVVERLSEPRATGPAPWIYDHNALFFEEVLGMNWEEIRKLEEAGAIK
jgi:hypothetical protein